MDGEDHLGRSCEELRNIEKILGVEEYVRNCGVGIA